MLLSFCDGLTAWIYNKSQQPRRTAGLCPYKSRKQKKCHLHLCKWHCVYSAKLYLAEAKSDTYVSIIAEDSKIVNPSKEKRLLSRLFTFALYIWSSWRANVNLISKIPRWQQKRDATEVTSPNSYGTWGFYAMQRLF